MLDEEVERLRDLRFNMETEIMSRDKLINEMRLKLPYTVPTSTLAPVTVRCFYFKRVYFRLIVHL